MNDKVKLALECTNIVMKERKQLMFAWCEITKTHCRYYTYFNNHGNARVMKIDCCDWAIDKWVEKVKK